MNTIPRSTRRGPRILLAILLGFAAAGGVYLYVSNVQQTAQAQTQAALQANQAAAAANANASKAVVAKTTLSAQTTLTADNVELRTVAPDAMQPNVETTLNDVLG